MYQQGTLNKNITTPRHRRKLGALFALGAALTLSAAPASAWIVDFFGFVPGHSSGFYWYTDGYGATIGSLSPTTTSDGHTIQSLLTYVDLGTGYYSVTLLVQFNGGVTPNAGWLNAMATPGGSLGGADATFSCPVTPTQCAWVWPYTYLDLTQTGTVAINHDN